MSSTWHAWQFILSWRSCVLLLCFIFLSVMKYLIEEKMSFSVITALSKVEILREKVALSAGIMKKDFVKFCCLVDCDCEVDHILVALFG